MLCIFRIMAINRKIYAALAALVVAGGIAASALHGGTVSAGGPVVAHNSSTVAQELAAYPVEAE